MFNNYPYTNFHELNLEYFINHFKEIFAEWESLYDELREWKTGTTEELEAWKTAVENDLDDREAALRAELEEWKAQTADDISAWETATGETISAWETGVLSDLNDWKTAFEQLFSTTFGNLQQIKTDAEAARDAAADSADDAADSATDAETSATAAATSASSIAASAAQIQTNANDISNLEDAINIYAGFIDEITLNYIANTVLDKPVMIKAGTRICFETSDTPSGQYVRFIYTDDTYDSARLNAGLTYRTSKDIKLIKVYNGTANATITCTIYNDELRVTNYYNPESTSDGYFNNSGEIISGNKHSDFIKVALGDTIISSAFPGTFGVSRMFFFDKNKSFKGFRNGTLREDGLYSFAIPLSTIGTAWVQGDIYYAAFNLPSSALQTAEFYINTVPNVELKYGQVQPNGAEYFNAQQEAFIKASETAAKTYTDSKISDIVVNQQSNNLYNPYDSKVTHNVIWQNQGEVSLNGYMTTAPIPVTTGDVLLYNKPTANLYTNFAAWVTANKEFISKISTPSETTEQGYTQITASQDGYISFNCSEDNAASLMIVKNQPMPEHYVPYMDVLAFTNKVNTKSFIKSRLTGKLIAYNGDSIAESRMQDGNAYNGGAYARIIAETVNGGYENRAHGGGILASAPGDGGSTPARCVVSDIINMTDDADLICFEGGINDYWRDVPLGSYVESDYTSTLDTATVCGALESIFRQAKAKWVGKPIVFVIVHKIKSTVYVQNQASTPYTFADAYEKIVGICHKYAIPYYDAFAESGLSAYDDAQNTAFLTSNSTGTPDGCHPNEAGYRRYYAPQLLALFESLMPILADE